MQATIIVNMRKQFFKIRHKLRTRNIYLFLVIQFAIELWHKLIVMEYIDLLGNSIGTFSVLFIQ